MPLSSWADDFEGADDTLHFTGKVVSRPDRMLSVASSSRAVAKIITSV